jgi:carnitine O-acetyltransferase
VTRAALACVDEALFVVALDLGSTPADSGAVADLVRQGNLDNRWFDKSLQLVVFANGKAALSFEHSAVDGHNGIRVAAEAQQRAAMPRCGRAESRLSPRRLVFRVPPEFCTMIESQRRDLAAQQAGRATRTLDAQGFGTTLWRALGVSADAAIQLALQLAAVRTWGELPAINEAVQLRHFRHGRYDTIYTVTPESRDFVQAVLRGEGGAAVVRAAAAAHRRLIAVCQRGDSPVLHYSAVLAAQRDHACLRADGEGLHVFGHRVARDPGYHALMHCRITTSNAGARPGVEVFGFADAEPGVLGAAYLVKADRVTLHLKADGELRSSLARFAHALAEALASVAAAAGSAVSPVVHHG